VSTGEVFYWHKRSDTSGGTGFANLKKASSVERRAAQVCLDRAFEMLFNALPKHDVKPEQPGKEDEEPSEGAKEK